MKIKKVYLENFKGIKDKKIVDFNNQTSLLIGPNGFGKTTIFDVLELCLTGKIHRTEIKDGVTNHSSDYNKPFYQHTENRNVVIKLWLKKRNKDLIIIKYLPYNHDGRSEDKGRKNKPTDFNLLKTFTESPENFEDTFSVSDYSEVLTQQNINDFFELESNSFKIQDVYNLFNYTQQEETTFFLKQSEYKRKHSLGFLFNTMEIEDKQNRISQFLSKIRNINKELTTKIDDLSNSGKIDQINYKQLFPDKDIIFDKENPFNNIEYSEIKQSKQYYYDELDKLITFIDRFSIKEYSKKQTVSFLNELIENDNFIENFILQNLLQDKFYDLIVVEKELLNNDTKIRAYILQNNTSNLKQLKSKNEKYNRYNKFLKITNFETQIKELKPFINEFMKDNIEEYNLLIETRKQNASTASELNNTITDIIRLRNELREEYNKDTNNQLNNSTCLFCGTDWENFEKLNEKFIEKEQTLKKLADNQTNILIDNEKIIINKFINPITNDMKEFIDNNAFVNVRIIDTLENLSKEEFTLSEFDKYDTKSFIWTTIKSENELENDVKQLKSKLLQHALVSDDLHNKLTKLKLISFEDTIKKMKNIISENELNNFIIKSNDDDKSLEKLNKYKKYLKNFLTHTKKEYSYIDEKANDPDNLFELYFSSNERNFNLINKTDLINKKKYIEFTYTQKQSSLIDLLNTRRKKLSNIITNIDNIHETYSDSITSHKKVMADKIKVPFYIYTAKVLQNYQQGMGVFLSTKPESDSIRFLTDSSTNHDAMHHLSSGQLAVVSLAFTLAINKTYNISPDLKFLTIDDPVQEMDSLNIHAFIELIRHEFLNEYQLIFSTHNDLNAFYMKYKFDKFTESEVNMINVQSEFFNH